VEYKGKTSGRWELSIKTYDEAEAVPIVRLLSILDCKEIGCRLLIADSADEDGVVVDAMNARAEVE
jgi:hypothetical protein